MAEQLKLLQPEKYVSLFLEKDIRPDGRKLASFGKTSVSVGCISSANGSALVHLRETTVVCGIKAELANPSADCPDCGFIVPNVDFPAVCSSSIMPGPPPSIVQLYSQLIVDFLSNSQLVDTANLSITEGKLCWCLYVDITCLNYSGNVLDAIVLALVAALSNTVLPKVCTDNDTVEVLDECLPLKIGEMAFSSTFGVFDKGIIADPTHEEEALASGSVTVFTQEKGMLCNVFMQHGQVNEDCLKQCIRLSKKRSKKLASLVRDLKPSVEN